MTKTLNKTTKQQNKSKVISALGVGFVEIISLPRKGVLRGVFLANHLATTELTSNNQETEHIQTHTNVITTSGPNKQQYTHSKNICFFRQTDRQTELGLGAFDDIWPTNGAGRFFQPWSPHGDHTTKPQRKKLKYNRCTIM